MSRFIPAKIILFMLLAGSAYAEKADREKPIKIAAANCVMNQKTQASVCTKDVVLTQGSLSIRADKLTVRQDDAGNQYVAGNGGPVRFRQKMDDSNDWVDAEALRFDYDGHTGIIKLMDKAWVKRGEDQVYSDLITYDLKNEAYQAQGRPEGNGRVNIVITPKKAPAP
ncbi:lipopolysaccharide transport periplasmic protein LptA [Iodobacter ciconiae]|uniref:Lipopolysaccharide export system protein LptA n=1 Tax=Iodobacter ciconiae TaxID=2496266 RepID=A0A3S8ZUN2_9NEIS|nr:lipopolysaccharide transport periplasmic protein LptA [Iodobacter ciconiae]AZN37200.1 lipopolysaccharide transport periplasmic protein LptA [Iodobacter ciconiae]